MNKYRVLKNAIYLDIDINRNSIKDSGLFLDPRIFIEYKGVRTNKQNALYWRRLEEIAQQANVNGRKFDSFCWHIYMKQHIMQTEFENKNGHVITKYRELPDGTTALRSTKDMSKKAFNEYIERVVAYAVTELDVKFSADYYESD